MNLATIDTVIIICYIIITLLFGFYVSKKASKDIKSYFLAGNEIPWYYLGLSNASGMFDISGTMWAVTAMFVYGLKSAWLPWLWPVWNQVFIMVFLAAWLRRSNVMTGAQWITYRFGKNLGARLSHIIVTVFAIISTLGFIAYFFEGIGKFATIFFPWDLSFAIGGVLISSEQSYALIIIAITTIYTLKGGMYSVVGTEVIQFVLMTISCLVIGYIAFTSVSAEQITNAVPGNWKNLFFGMELDLDWTGYIDSVNAKIEEDGFSLFGFLFMMMIFKGIFASLAGPVPSYDMQRILSTKNEVEASKMSGLTIIVLSIPRYLMITGFAILGLVYLGPELQEAGSGIDFETILPLAIQRFIPVGLKGLLLAGLLAAFMGTFAAFINAAPAYLVNDIYKKYIKPNASNKTYIRFSYLSSILIVIIGLLFGFFASSINTLTLWLTSALYGGYAAANMLKWIWWRFNSYGYFGGMLAGLIAATIVPTLFTDTSDIYLFPLILVISFLGCILGVYLGKPDDIKVLKNFYKTTKPWGFWKPVIKELQKDDPTFTPNEDFRKDVLNCIIGVVWQMTFVLAPIYLIIKEYYYLSIVLVLMLITSLILKRTWYDKIKQIKN
ncbi:sodium:solute symporter [Aquimarina sp. AD10]|uniref:sodium:solute symporter family protein n=1 Tax=Aquimarina sp. AD10 TaxID=1714849 RepID=UPI000E4A5C5C|nr:sodium:solute symporter family protein [Aquimarina sp. AD10]AXT60145.1 sodium:solute symporter [Aquimarina sp. AD10]RKN00061.1 sodium:solute symporter [Aquimarina sp. AD10]